MEVVEEEVDSEDKDEQDIEEGGPVAVAGALGEEEVGVGVAEPQVSMELDGPKRPVDASEGVCDTTVVGI